MAGWTITTPCVDCKGCGGCPNCQRLASCLSLAVSGLSDYTGDQWTWSVSGSSGVYDWFQLSKLDVTVTLAKDAPPFQCLWGAIFRPPTVNIPVGAMYIDSAGNVFASFGVMADVLLQWGISEGGGGFGLILKYSVTFTGFMSRNGIFLPPSPGIQVNVDLASTVFVASGASCVPVYLPFSTATRTVGVSLPVTFLMSGSEPTLAALGTAC